MRNSKCFQLIVLLLFAGLVRGGLHIVKIVILAGLGLAGMWMLHTLAQDYDKIATGFSGAPARIISKRSSITNDLDIPEFPQFKWETILSQDPENCVPKFICQLAAVPDGNLLENERNILKLIRATSVTNTKANKIVRQALNLGEQTQMAYCHKYFASCPYNRETMVALIQTYGR